MRRLCLILVGISALGCRDPNAKKTSQGAAEAPASPTAQKQTTPDPAPSVPAEQPRVERDQAWRDAMTKTIETVAPDLTAVTCGNIECSATLTAPSDEELVARAEKLQSEDSLRQLEARGVVLSAPIKKDGKSAMTIRVLFDE
ncbi:MAG TPA: hypothetical protein VMZ53_22320 [Kofleriaceae bacterium]|nr:hypothetical protein [Kofleriaceae bacterium]